VLSSREDYVRPPVLAREPAPRWHGVWRFRAVALMLSIALLYAVWLIASHFINNESNPGFNPVGAPPAASAGRPAAAA
jgi:hypothetical protein